MYQLTDFDSPDAQGSGERYMDRNHVAMLNRAGKAAGFYPKINSGYRTPAHNAKVGGAESSCHMEGKASDLSVRTRSDFDRIAPALVAVGFRRFGVASTFLHVDNCSRSEAVWTYGGGAEIDYRNKRIRELLGQQWYLADMLGEEERGDRPWLRVILLVLFAAMLYYYFFVLKGRF
ncbi:D-Ala-D-Ala carboxypeptidase family metallohydrolase [Rhodoflexus caldus]|uniref:D-Ala-D-Ala carboxypeptidase family metallohydrolase n=1 Tax=Rhodoflexus caldus TaxID=2891236 RepID=UPI00202A40AE|nr:D-Ala-D-Ala carboxypeptidase family metallohydrolase [Rhodoflexus caldus]